MNRLALVTVTVFALTSLVAGFAIGRSVRDRAAPPPSRAIGDRHAETQLPSNDAAPIDPPVEKTPAAAVEATDTTADSTTADAIPAALGLEAIGDNDLASLADLVDAAPRPDQLTHGWLSRTPDVASRTLALRGAVPTAMPDGTGELTHPLVASRLAAAILERAGLGFTAAQWEEVARLVDEYESAVARLESGYSSETIRLDRVLDEIELKEQFVSSFLDALSDAQRARLVGDGAPPPFLSPLLIADVHAMPFPPARQAEIRAGFAREISNDFGIPADIASGLADALFRDLAPLLDPTTAAGLTDIDRTLLAGRALASVLRGIVAAPGVDEPTRQRILAVREWMVPDVNAGQ